MSKKYYVGIDQSLQNTGIIVLDEKGELLESQNWKPVKMKDVERLDYFYNEIHRMMLSFDGIDVKFAMEGYSYSRFNMAILGELGGVIKLAFKHMGEPLIIYPPSTIKKFVCGKGTAKKEMIMKEVFKKWGFDTNDNNLSDAFGIARLLFEVSTGLYKLPEKKIKKEKK